LISNAAAEEVSGWSACALAPWFDTVVFSYQVGLVKPDPAIYQLACAQLGVEAARCWFIGDGGSDELQGAALAGLTPGWATWFLQQWGPARLLAQPQAHPAGLLRLSTPADVVRMLSTL
jgi:FMN phosphatase YigB (HAD superfamily)